MRIWLPLLVVCPALTACNGDAVGPPVDENTAACGGGTCSSALGGSNAAGGTQATGGSSSSSQETTTAGRGGTSGGSYTGGQPTGGSQSIQSTGGVTSTGGDASFGGNNSGLGGTNSGGTVFATGGTNSGGTVFATGGTNSGGTVFATGGTNSGGTVFATGGMNSGGTASATGGMNSGGSVFATGGATTIPTCSINGITYFGGTVKSDNPCVSCQPDISNSSWTMSKDGTGCGQGQVCRSSVCESGCWIDSKFYTKGSVNPNSACSQCDPSSSTVAFSAQPDGTEACSAGQVCVGGLCQNGCWIDSAFYTAASSNPRDECAQCDPARLATNWTPAPDGTSCSRTGNMCFFGACMFGCMIGGQVLPINYPNPGNWCQVCQPTLSASGWSNTSHCVTAITAGQYHTCAIDYGDVKCWGNNSHGQLGIGPLAADADVPTPVLGLPGDATQVSAGDSHTCAIVNGNVYCWGDDGQGQLGNVLLGDNMVPMPVGGLTSSVLGLSAGSKHTCALTKDGAFCWGNNAWGQLGNNSTANSFVPVAVQGLTGTISAISAGAQHTCALVDGKVFCWGGNGKGQLGNNSTSTSLVPVQVQGLEANIATLGVGSYHGCAANPNGTSGINCWGDNEYGQLGIGSFAATLIALPNAILTNSPGLISAGGGHTCALYHPMGDLRCWGDNEFGQLGNGSHVNSTYAVQIQQVQVGTQDLATGAGHTCALTQNNIQCWGDNQYGQLGSGSTISVAAPIPVQFQ